MSYVIFKYLAYLVSNKKLSLSLTKELGIKRARKPKFHGNSKTLGARLPISYQEKFQSLMLDYQLPFSDLFRLLLEKGIMAYKQGLLKDISLKEEELKNPTEDKRERKKKIYFTEPNKVFGAELNIQKAKEIEEISKSLGLNLSETIRLLVSKAIELAEEEILEKLVKEEKEKIAKEKQIKEFLERIVKGDYEVVR